MAAWHTLADAIFEQGYGTSAQSLYDEHGTSDNAPNVDEIREQLGLELAGLPTWYFNAVKQLRSELDNNVVEVVL